MDGVRYDAPGGAPPSNTEIHEFVCALYRAANLFVCAHELALLQHPSITDLSKNERARNRFLEEHGMHDMRNGERRISI